MPSIESDSVIAIMSVFEKNNVRILGVAESFPETLILAQIVITKFGNSNNNTKSQV